MKPSLEDAVSKFGLLAKSKLSSAAVKGEPEDQLRAPFEQLLQDMATLCGLPLKSVVAVGETSLAEQRTRPDYAVTVRGSLAGFVELKAPGKGADPRRFRPGHDKEQWLRLQSLPNLLYTDGNEFSLWRNGERAAEIVRLDGDIETAGSALTAGPSLQALFEHFLGWEPISPRSAKELAEVSARLCRLLRDEVVEALERKAEALTTLAADWRGLLFPSASDKQFADGYAQAVTFGLLMARARGISIGTDLHRVAEGLSQTASLIGAALQLLTDNKATRDALATSLQALERVLDAVNWPKLSKGRGDAWLYFYEDFLEIYDNSLRKQTGSYYTPPEVVSAMVALVDEALRRPGFDLPRGIATDSVIVADPATGTGTFVLGVLRHLAGRVAADEGEGAVPAAISSALQRLIAFELQLGPFAVAQLRVFAEVAALTGAMPSTALRMFVTDTLGNPTDDGGAFPGFTAAIGMQRRAANRVKREQPITVVIGNPPYKDKAKGLGGWVEGADRKRGEYAPLDDWQPPPAWGLGAHSKHLRNLYIYFWRWASRKVFEDLPGQAPGGGSGIVAYITVAGFLSGPGFERMRQDLRQRCHEIWVIDCSPEGHQPEAATRIFQAVQQPVCIVLAARWPKERTNDLAPVRWTALPRGHRSAKFEALAALRLDGPGWRDCGAGSRDPFMPASMGAWAEFPRLQDLFEYGGSGVQPMRVWVIAPDAESLHLRWRALIEAPADKKQLLFHPTLRAGVPADRHIDSALRAPLAGYPGSLTPLAEETLACLAPARYAARSFDRQWIIPDIRVITQPNWLLWESNSESQVYATALHDRHPGAGPALTFAATPPDKHHFKGSFGGKVFPLWLDATLARPNLRQRFVAALGVRLARELTSEEVLAYLAAVAGHAGFVKRFNGDLASPGLRVPLTTEPALFREAVTLGRRIVWLHTFGERWADSAEGRDSGPPRLPAGRRPQVPKDGAIPTTPDGMPNSLVYDAEKQRLNVGTGFIEPVPAAVWNYEVGGKQVLVQWFNSRKREREKPQIGDRRAPSPLGDIQPETWLAEYTTELLNVLNVLGLLVDMEPALADLLHRICAGPLLDDATLRKDGVFAATEAPKTKAATTPTGPDLLTGVPSLGE
ncbi:MAG: type ISP restriction/modification enzyme [Rubrivivax sp.]|nr:type ISP restriction/modification enzyme [Rubrivivax sp.]